MRLFVSYVREDQSRVQPLVQGLRLLHHEVWLDEELSGGQTWWEVILERIRSCDGLLLALSPGSLDSEACQREREYALALRKPLLPVMVRRVPPEVLPPELATIQIVDYTESGEEPVFRLAGALAMLPSALPLPDQMPVPPPVPISYLSELSHRISASTLTLDEQLALVGRLRTALARDRERDAAVHLLQELRERDDLYHATARELDQIEIIEADRQQREPRSPLLDDSQRKNIAVSEARVSGDWYAILVGKQYASRKFQVRLNEDTHYIDVKARYYYFSVLVDGEVVARGTDMANKPAKFTLTDGGRSYNASLECDVPTTGRIGYIKLVVGEKTLYEHGRSDSFL